LLLVVVVWGAGLLLTRSRVLPASARPSWQRSFLELSPPQQRAYRELREAVFEAENRRADVQAWPEVAWLVEQGVPPFSVEGWSLRRKGPYASYVGEAEGLRWLVLFIEPEPMALGTVADVKAPDDEEHHTLRDGTALHVTVWTAPSSTAVPEGVLAFPASEGWLQRVGQ
jgi:hypothetical protein